jgi:hypothetical protein
MDISDSRVHSLHLDTLGLQVYLPCEASLTIRANEKVGSNAKFLPLLVVISAVRPVFILVNRSDGATCAKLRGRAVC